MKRILFLVPNVELAEEVADDLLLARIEERHIHIIANDKVPLGDLPEANVMQKSDFVPALQKGMVGGGATGILAGLAVLAFPAVGMSMAGGII